MVSMPALNKDLPVPLYHQLKCVLMEDIETGKWQPGQQLPTETRLAADFGVSKITVRQALQGLADLGYIHREQGRGTFVSKPRFDHGPRERTSFSEEMRRHKRVPGSRVLSQSVAPCDARAAEMLRIPPGEPVCVLKRLRLADAEPMGIQTAYIPLKLASGLPQEKLENASLYDVLRLKFGMQPSRAREMHFAAVASPADAKMLGIAAGAPVFEAERVTWLANGTPFEFVKSVMRGDRYSITLDLTIRPR